MPVHGRHVACGDGEARSLFAESSIGDTDGDGAMSSSTAGAPDRVPPLGAGLRFGDSINAEWNSTMPPTHPTHWATAGSGDHDPFDLFRAQPRRSGWCR